MSRPVPGAASLPAPFVDEPVSAAPETRVALIPRPRCRWMVPATRKPDRRPAAGRVHLLDTRLRPSRTARRNPRWMRRPQRVIRPSRLPRRNRCRAIQATRRPRAREPGSTVTLSFSADCWTEVTDSSGASALLRSRAALVALSGCQRRRAAQAGSRRRRQRQRIRRRPALADPGIGTAGPARKTDDTRAVKTRSIRGMNDLLPGVSATWRHVESVPCAPLSSPTAITRSGCLILEYTEVFARAIGEVTDIVEKEMYTFRDRNDESLTLRPEATAGMVRAGITNGLFHNQRQKLWTLGPMFRYEKAPERSLPAVPPVRRRGHGLRRPRHRCRDDHHVRQAVGTAWPRQADPSDQHAGLSGDPGPFTGTS